MPSALATVQKTPTGIEGLDEITTGGLPTGRTSLICGSAGSGKTVMALEFLVHGARDFNEPGVFMAFEETERELTQNIASFGYDLEQLEKDGKIAIDHVFIERSEIETPGNTILKVSSSASKAVNSIGARRVVLDTLEVLFAGLKNQSLIRSELRRLFRWLKDKGLTAIVTGERGDGQLTRYGLEEYVADCVILLDHRVNDQVSTRRLRIVKYRGSAHGTDEYPFLMGGNGISVLPLTSVGLTHGASAERVSSGIADLDGMLGGGKGFYKGSSILVSGTPGTGKTNLALSFLKAACNRGEKTLYFGFEESRDQIIRNTASIGLDLQPAADSGLLHFHTVRPSNLGLEAHLASMHQTIKDVDPTVVVVDPISNFISAADQSGVKSMLIRLVDFLKMKQVTALFTHLTPFGDLAERTDENVSSIMDTWILLRDLEHEGQRTYGLYVLKSRGMYHSHELRAFRLTDNGIQLGDVYTKRRM